MFLLKRKVFLFSLIFSFFCAFTANAQRRHNGLINTRALINNEKLGFTFGGGLTSYYGDLCDKFECMHFRPNFGIGAMLRLTDNIGIKADLSYFRLYSDDVWEQRNLDFRSNNAEFAVMAYYQYFPYERYRHKQKKWNIYAFLGLGLSYFSPQGSLNGKWHNLRPLQTEGVKYSPITAIIPYGAGFSFRLNKQWQILIEGSYRKTFTDHLDDVSSKEWRLSNTFEDKLAAQVSNKTGMGDAYWLKTGQYRGNPAKKDGYFMGQIKLKYTILTKVTHYRLRRSPMRKRF